MKLVALTHAKRLHDETGSIRCINIQQYGPTFLVKLTGPGIGAPGALFPFRSEISGCPAHKGPETRVRGLFAYGWELGALKNVWVGRSVCKAPPVWPPPTLPFSAPRPLHSHSFLPLPRTAFPLPLPPLSPFPASARSLSPSSPSTSFA